MILTILSNAERLERARELKQSVEGNYEHTANIQDYELVEWLIEQAEKVERLRYVLESIINIDGYFIGTDKEFDYETAYRMIDDSAREALEETK